MNWCLPLILAPSVVKTVHKKVDLVIGLIKPEELKFRACFCPRFWPLHNSSGILLSDWRSANIKTAGNSPNQIRFEKPFQILSRLKSGPDYLVFCPDFDLDQQKIWTMSRIWTRFFPGPDQNLVFVWTKFKYT